MENISFDLIEEKIGYQFNKKQFMNLLFQDNKKAKDTFEIVFKRYICGKISESLFKLADFEVITDDNTIDNCFNNIKTNLINEDYLIDSIRKLNIIEDTDIILEKTFLYNIVYFIIIDSNYDFKKVYYSLDKILQCDDLIYNYFRANLIW